LFHILDAQLKPVSHHTAKKKAKYAREQEQKDPKSVRNGHENEMRVGSLESLGVESLESANLYTPRVRVYA